jgi:cytochrome c peroxidase
LIAIAIAVSFLNHHAVAGRKSGPVWSRRFSSIAIAVSLAWLLTGRSSFAEKLQIQIVPEWKGHPIQLNSPPGPELKGFSLTRIDGLLSDLALKRTDGSWLEARDWFAFFSLAKNRLAATADGLPAEEFTAIRFRVGLNEQVNGSDTAQWEAGHSLHPEVNGLHWGWSSGYVFLALEGYWESSAEKVTGFSYHLAGPAEPMMIEIPVNFSGGRPNTLRLGFDLATILAGGALMAEASSTHSRTGDELAVKMKRRVVGAFRLVGLEADLFQTVESKNEAVVKPAGRPYPVQISERLPKVKLPADNPLTIEGVALGREIFHDTRLSINNSQSCASCHEASKGFADGRAYSVGAKGTAGRRSAMPLVNLAWAKEFFWDGRAKTLREQVLKPIQDAHEMNESLASVEAKLRADERYVRKFKEAFGPLDGTEVTAERIGQALEQYLLTLVSQDSRFDRAARKLTELNAQEKRGLELFVTEHDPARGLRGADCFHCHGGNLFSNQQFMNNGLAERANDLGRMEVTGKESDRAKFKVPTLRNIALTAPYMHDGRFATLEEVVEHYNSGVQRTRTLDPNLAKHPESGLGLSKDDKEALVAFLKTLTDEEFTKPTLQQFSKTN